MSRHLARLIGAAAVIPALALTSACGSSGEEKIPPGVSSVADDTSTPELSNPVIVLKKIEDCRLEDGTEVGETDMNGNRYASCSFKDNGGTNGTSITVRTYPGDPKELLGADELRSDDSHKKIVGTDFVLTILGDFSSYAKHVDPAAIATVVGGEYIPAS